MQIQTPPLPITSVFPPHFHTKQRFDHLIHECLNLIFIAFAIERFCYLCPAQFHLELYSFVFASLSNLHFATAVHISSVYLKYFRLKVEYFRFMPRFKLLINLHVFLPFIFLILILT